MIGRGLVSLVRLAISTGPCRAWPRQARGTGRRCAGAAPRGAGVRFGSVIRGRRIAPATRGPRRRAASISSVALHSQTDASSDRPPDQRTRAAALAEKPARRQFDTHEPHRPPAPRDPQAADPRAVGIRRRDAADRVPPMPAEHGRIAAAWVPGPRDRHTRDPRPRQPPFGATALIRGCATPPGLDVLAHDRSAGPETPTAAGSGMAF